MLRQVFDDFGGTLLDDFAQSREKTTAGDLGLREFGQRQEAGLSEEVLRVKGVGVDAGWPGKGCE